MIFYGNVLNGMKYTMAFEFLMTKDILFHSLGPICKDRTYEVQDMVNLMVLARANKTGSNLMPLFLYVCTIFRWENARK